jgi:hypothetical protein
LGGVRDGLSRAHEGTRRENRLAENGQKEQGLAL